MLLSMHFKHISYVYIDYTIPVVLPMKVYWYPIQDIWIQGIYLFCRRTTQPLHLWLIKNIGGVEMILEIGYQISSKSIELSPCYWNQMLRITGMKKLILIFHLKTCHLLEVSIDIYPSSSEGVVRISQWLWQDIDV